MLVDRKSAMDLMLISGLNETMVQLAVTYCVHCYRHVVRRKDGNVLRRALDLEVESQEMKERMMWVWKKQVEE